MEYVLSLSPQNENNMTHKNMRRTWLIASIAFILWLPGVTYGQQLTTFETTNFSGSGVCAFCHNRLSDQAGHERFVTDLAYRSTFNGIRIC